MIGVKIPMKDSTKTKAQHIRDLTDYIVNPADEKVLYMCARSFLTDTFLGQRAEMIALAEEAIKSKMPVKHYVLSWQEDERPSPYHVEEAIGTFLREMKLNGHQVIYAVHQNTDNLHLHIAVNLVNPFTLKVVKPNKGFDIEAIHKTVARIEHAQGWNREPNGRYVVRENGKLVKANIFRSEQLNQPAKRPSEMEIRTGEKSAERIAQERVPQIIRAAQSWQDLHEQLAAAGMRYMKKGSGAVIRVGEIHIKASNAAHGASLPSLQNRFGQYEPASEGLLVAALAPEPLTGGCPGWSEYHVQRKSHYAEKNKETTKLRSSHAAERRQLLGQQKGRRMTELGGSWKGRGTLMNAQRSIIAAQQAAEKAALKERHALERRSLRERYGRFPDFEEWLIDHDAPDLAVAWRYRHSHIGRMLGHSYVQPVPTDIRAYKHSVGVKGSVNYRSASIGAIAFTDFGKNIGISDYMNPDCVLAALQLSAQKWGRFEVYGNGEYKSLCVTLAAKHGFKIDNPELQTSIERERQRLQGSQRSTQNGGAKANQEISRQDSGDVGLTQDGSTQGPRV